MRTENTYETSELPLAATLLCYGFPLAGLDRTYPKRVIFKFDVVNNELSPIDGFIDLYWSKRGAIEPSAFYANLRFLKSRTLARDAKIH